MDDHKEPIALLPLHNRPADKREFEVDPFSARGAAMNNKRQRRSKNRPDTSSSEDVSQFGGSPDAPKDKGRGRYACLNHRLKHKRCPPDCKERRPKPMQSSDMSPQSPTSYGNQDSPSRNLLELQEPVTAQLLPESANLNPIHTPAPLSAPVGLNPMVTVSALPSLADCPLEWDSVEWEGLMEGEHSQNQWGGEVEGWDDIQTSGAQWDSSESSVSMQTESAGAPQNNANTTANATEGIARDYALVNGSSSEAFGQMRHLLSPILLTRDVLERWLVEPYFNRLLQGFFVRVRIGEYMDTSVYRIARVDEVVDRAFFTYNLGKEQTTKGVVLQIGSTKKTFSLLSVSNKLPTEQDFQHWEEEMVKQRNAISEEEVRQKEEIVRVMNLKYPYKMTQAFASTSN
jgi:hypothetical protein